jgi:hypothetical protein
MGRGGFKAHDYFESIESNLSNKRKNQGKVIIKNS